MDKKLKIDQVCTTAEQFSKLFYECMDKKRNLLSKLYMETAVLMWNGKTVTGNMEIQKFLESLPAGEFMISCLDGQPIAQEAVQNQSTVLITTAGSVRFDKKTYPFSQNFVVTAQGDKWKIVSDIFRFQEVTPQ